jgi:hypothetical protein
MIEQDYRLPSNSERQILNKLLKVNFRDRDVLRQQLEGLLVEQIDDNGSLSLKVTAKGRADIPGGVAVEGRYLDSEAVDAWEPNVNILLHVAEGQLKLLEIYKDGGSKIRRDLDPEGLRLFSQHAIPKAGG